MGDKTDSGSKSKLLVAAALIAAFVVVTKVLRGGDQQDESSGDEGGIDRIDTRTEEADERAAAGAAGTAGVTETAGDRTLTLGARETLDELDLVDYVAILAAALRAARDEYQSRAEGGARGLALTRSTE